MGRQAPLDPRTMTITTYEDRDEDADQTRERGVEGRAQGTGQLQRADGARRAIQLQLEVREWGGLQPRGAARRGGCGVLQHGSRVRAREGGLRADERGDDGRLLDREAGRRVEDHSHGAALTRRGAWRGSGEV